ncbi:MAG: phospholipase D-like domain-containing protein [archaeon]|nr:phospholipase D-like domain-containing protein [archaeon]
MFLLLLCVLVIPQSDGSFASSGDPLLITEVSPVDEAVTIKNTGYSTVDLKGYSVTDGEGTLTFSSSYKLSPQAQIIISKDSGTDWFNSRPEVIVFTSHYLTKSGSFTLANAGDEVRLCRNNSTLDSVCYGNSNGVDGWIGGPVGISTGHHLIRSSDKDTDRAEDWISTKAGWTNFGYGIESFDATVSPFSFPESNGEQVLFALSKAEMYIDISIYLISSPKVVSLLCQMEKNGVEVRILAEGSPLGVDISTELSLLRSLVDSGGEVRLINYNGASEHRYSYVHNKYAVIDGETVIITSENWTSGNMGEYGNRGWGVIVESEEYADYMESVFENDYSMLWGDVKEFLSLYPKSKPYSDMPVVEIINVDLPSYQAKVSPVLSPDNSYGAMKEFITSAEYRLYAEQMDLGSSLSMVSGDTPVSWMSSVAGKGVDTRFILDSSQSNGSAHETYVNLITSATEIKAINVNMGENFALIHNKGVIADDSVWIGSVNWTENSFQRNRESALVIRSSEVADYYAGLFLSDFGTNIYTAEENGISLEAKVVGTSKGNVVLLTVDGPSGFTYEWSLGDGKVRIGENTVVLFEAPSEGDYTASVRMNGTEMVAYCDYSVGPMDNGDDDKMTEYSLLLAVVLLCLGLMRIVILKRSEKRCIACRFRQSPYRPYR